jgi:hypothetical protein
MVIVLLNLRLLDKGKPPERVGRKATGLSRAQADMVAGLPGKRSTFGSVLVVFRPNGSERCDNENKRIRAQEVIQKPHIFLGVVGSAANLRLGPGGTSDARLGR